MLPYFNAVIPCIFACSTFGSSNQSDVFLARFNRVVKTSPARAGYKSHMVSNESAIKNYHNMSAIKWILLLAGIVLPAKMQRNNKKPLFQLHILASSNIVHEAVAGAVCHDENPCDNDEN